jgi:hypothetical protein
MAKKTEAREKDIADAVDFVLTFQEVKDIFDIMQINPADMEESEKDHSSRAGRIYAHAGGVSEAVEITLNRLNPNRKISIRTKHADGVPKDGKIKAEDVGETKLTLNYDGMSASYKICVVEDKRDLYFDGIKVNSKLKTLYYNGTTDNETSISVTVPDNRKYSLKFSSEDSKVAKVSGKGIVTPVGEGTTYITTRVIIGNYSKEYKTKITSKPASIAFTASKSTLTVGQQFIFKAQAYGLSGKLTWSVSDPKILSINPDTGKVTAKSAGTAYVIVKNGKFSVKMKVNVRK